MPALFSVNGAGQVKQDKDNFSVSLKNSHSGLWYLTKIINLKIVLSPQHVQPSQVCNENETILLKFWNYEFEY